MGSDRIKLSSASNLQPNLTDRTSTGQVPDKLPSSNARLHDKLPSDNPNIMKLITHGKGRCCLSGMTIDKAVSHASAAFVVRLQNSFVHKALDFAEGGVVACVE